MKILITGISGQDGSYLAEFLLEKGFIDHIVNRKELKETLYNLYSSLGYNEEGVENE